MNIMCQQSGVSDVEAFIDSYLELLNSGMSHEDVERNCQWVEKNPYFDPENPYNCEEYNTVFVIEDVENWFNEMVKNIAPCCKWTNQDVRDVFDGKCTKKYGNYGMGRPIVIGDIKKYHEVQYVQIQNLFFMCKTYLIKTSEDRVFSIWY